MDSRAFGIDISRYQSSADGKKKMNFDKVAAHKTPVTFIVARAGVSWSYQDPMFDYYWAEMARIKVCRMAYFVPHFGESATAQMDALFRCLDGKADWKYDRLCLDLEVAGINPRQRITATTLKCLDIVKARTGRYPVIYSRANWLDTYISLDALPQLDFWLAQYKKPLPWPLFTDEHPGPPTLPKGATTWLIHQTGDKCAGIGSVSTSMDYNRWNGDVNDVWRYFGNPRGVALPVPPPANQALFKAKCIVSALYKRSKPSKTGSVLGSLSMGDVISVYEVENGWFRIDPNAQIWCNGSPQFLQKLEDTSTLNAVLFRARCVVKALYKREAPSKAGKIIGNLIINEVVNVYQEANGWFRISPTAQVWCHGGRQYMRRL